MTPTRREHRKLIRPAARGLAAITASAAAIAGMFVAAPTAQAEAPLQVSTVADGLTIPWGVVVAPDGTVLTGERSGKFLAVRPDGKRVNVAADLSKIFAVKEAGLMGLAIDPRFSDTRRVYSCQAEYTTPGAFTLPGSVADLPIPAPQTGQTIKVVSWRVNADWTRMTRERTLLSGIPVTSSGRHAGCGLAATADSIWVGTGDSATPSVPQDRKSLGGKVLHLRLDGTPAPGNPDSRSPVYSLGHRNIQGVAVAPGSGRVYVAEQGTSRDDELNLVVAGGNYGYKPDRTPLIYDESVPMTDTQRVPGAIGPVWSSGNSTIATPGIAFLPDTGWGPYSGGLVLTALKGKRLVFLKLSDDGRRVVSKTEALEQKHGRLRSAAIAPDGSLVLTTSDGDGTDRILRVRWED
ncbi:PQQ-dependent sugar dehydrogenase [Gordonia sp. C13]|uniref:PQQ-dependent sugar dehydrogenase n=1 Tax=Gordonia sp. C13 TaxID=2935078 RepID=UPI00200A8575|nr:PQQ-dependent sugar dehydrogenase [Gordonia sp. C13]MCK8613562.1 PQQ-dependent sugar dehydrogenase [Gordonia sp. C13]